jgi:hypothetical protein
MLCTASGASARTRTITYTLPRSARSTPLTPPRGASSRAAPGHKKVADRSRRRGAERISRALFLRAARGAPRAAACRVPTSPGLC